MITSVEAPVSVEQLIQNAEKLPHVSRVVSYIETLKILSHDPSLVDINNPPANSFPFFLQQHSGAKDAVEDFENLPPKK